MRFIKQRSNRLDALDERIVGIVDQEGEVAAAELRKRYEDLAALPSPTFYERLHTLARAGYIVLRHDRQFIVLGSLVTEPKP
jgi:DNA-binding Lrp family transcriptional regulator